jgi:hypothetical protein
MKAAFIFNCILVTTLLGSHAVFASSQAESADKKLQEPAGYMAASEDVEGLAKNLLTKINADNYAEVLQRILMDSRQELTRQLNATAAGILHDALKFTENYLDLSLSTAAANLDLTSR